MATIVSEFYVENLIFSSSNHRIQRKHVVKMANVQVTAVQNQQNAHNANEQPLMPITLLLRFLYKGSTSSSIPVKAAPNVINIDNTLSCVIEMANARAQLPISTIRKVCDINKNRRGEHF